MSNSNIQQITNDVNPLSLGLHNTGVGNPLPWSDASPAGVLSRLDFALSNAHAISPDVPIACPGSDPGSLPVGDPRGQGTESPYYLDHKPKGHSPTCPGWFVPGECSTGHNFGKIIYCGREWCPTCGENWSDSHKRRFARWLPKAMQIEEMGYLVFTMPLETRERYRSKAELRKLGAEVQKLLKSLGYSRGLRRWHWFGDKSLRWNPHLNVLVDGGYIAKTGLRTLRELWAAMLGVDMADVHYSYTTVPKKMVHILKYVTRSTFREYNWDPEMAEELYNFRNQVWWGSGLWNDDPVWECKGEARLAEVESLEQSLCPICGLPIKWGKPMSITWLQICEAAGWAKEIGAGYYYFDSS